ncbi:hypothetical protein B0J14DRAFT_670318 [Halenospora varia]|nr:hypothetical protein B0J14DRAFT_670318 [Halenospora varia]
MAFSDSTEAAKVSVTQIFEFTSHFIGNIHLRPNGSCIYRINTVTRKVDVAFADPLLGHGPTFKVGINGPRIFNGYLYFTNSGQGTVGRVKIADDGSKAGDIEIVARIPGMPPGMGHAYDDFTLDSYRNAVMCLLVMRNRDFRDISPYKSRKDILLSPTKATAPQKRRLVRLLMRS